MQPTVATQSHVSQVDRRSHVHDQRQDLVGVSSDEMVDFMGSVCPLGVWRLEMATGRMFWSEDAVLVTQLMEAPTTGKNGDRCVMRVCNGGGGYRLIASAVRHRSLDGGELCGHHHELQDMVRSVVLADG
ncbi:MAG: hypothetical protein ABJN75_23420 [Hoeflea sp.]|uniref:hypothetical protein n=1 Tax=Hoeflea sp. TaxID=1940281 RepID=UPI00329857CE